MKVFVSGTFDILHAGHIQFFKEAKQYGMAHALIFDPQGIPLPPTEVLYKKNVLALRSSFRPPTLLNVDMIQAGREHFLKEEGVRSEDVVVLCEMTLKNIKSRKMLFLRQMDY